MTVAEVVVATSNPGKLREISEILGDLPVRLRGLASLPGVELPDEGDDYRANALAKAGTAARCSGRLALGDDSGLEVDALGGGPGARSARYGGPGLDDAGRVDALLDALRGVADAGRRARFVCVAALVDPDGEIATARGVCEGRILQAPSGQGGFGYDPIFAVDAAGGSMAELAPEQKNRISHRARAFQALRAALHARLA